MAYLLFSSATLCSAMLHLKISKLEVRLNFDQTPILIGYLNFCVSKSETDHVM